MTGVFEPVALSAGLQDMAAVRETVQRGTGEPLTTEHLGPVLKRQVGRHKQNKFSSWSLPSQELRD